MALVADSNGILIENGSFNGPAGQAIDQNFRTISALLTSCGLPPQITVDPSAPAGSLTIGADGSIAATGNISAGKSGTNAAAVVLATTGNVLLGGVGDPSDIYPTMGLWGRDAMGLPCGLAIASSAYFGGIALAYNAVPTSSGQYTDLLVSGSPGQLLYFYNAYMTPASSWAVFLDDDTYVNILTGGSDGSGALANGAITWDAGGGMTWANNNASVNDDGSGALGAITWDAGGGMTWANNAAGVSDAGAFTGASFNGWLLDPVGDDLTTALDAYTITFPNSGTATVI